MAVYSLEKKMTFPTLDQWVSYTGLFITICSTLFGVMQYSEKKRFRNYIRDNNWFGFQRSDNTSATIQHAKMLYMKKYSASIDPEILDHLSMADAFSQELVKESVRQIQISEPSFTINDFKRWELEGKLRPDKVQLFKMFAADPRFKSIFGLWPKRIV